MSDTDRARWDERYRTQVVDWTPAPVVSRCAPPAAPGARALDVACGAGRHSLTLAELGYTVDAVDISAVALAQLVTEAERRGLAERVHPLCADLDVWRPPAARYAVVVQVAFFDRALLPATLVALEPGGLLILEAFNTARLVAHPDFNPAFLLQRGELAVACAGWDILELDDAVGPAADRSHIVARR